MCLEHIAKQTIVNDLEVIVVSDGPDEEVKKMIHSYQSALPGREETGLTVRYYDVAKSQQGVARNAGVKHATAERVLFIGDDIFLEPTACEKHLLSATRYPQAAVLGFTTWDPVVGITPVMKWLEKSGWQFGYPMLKKYEHAFLPKNIQHQFTYTSHISLPTHIAREIPFRTDITMYGWEDIEWGMRLRDAGIKLFYEPDATALHHHSITMEESLGRMEVLGKSAKMLSEKIPNFDRVPTGLKLFAYKMLAMLPTMAGKHRQQFLRGMKGE